MSTSGNHSHKEEKRGPSAIKQSGMEDEKEKREPKNSSQLETEFSKLTIKTKMSTSDNHSHKEEKRSPSAIKQSGMEDEKEKREPENSSQLETEFSKLSIKMKMSTSGNHSHKEEKRGPSSIKQSGMEDKKEKRDQGNSNLDQFETEFNKLSVEDSSVNEKTSQSDRKEIKVKFLINVPMEVTATMSTSSESHCEKILDLLIRKAFRKEDEHRYKDIAVVFGLNGKNSIVVKNEWQKKVKSDITFKKTWFTWRNKDNKVPYQVIREQIKKHSHSKELVRQFRRHSEVNIYFCFFDADTVNFNEVLSSYVDIIIEHNYPTVMSTGFLFPEKSEFRKKSECDRQVRIITAKHFPLGTYYPEPNFCVLLPDGHDTLHESFINTEFKQNNMESAVLIRKVKEREGFTAVFADKNPIITVDSRQKHCHTNPRTWAISAYAHKELIITHRCREEYIRDRTNASGIYFFAITLLRNLINPSCEEKKVDDIKNGGFFEGDGEDKLFRAAKAVREYLITYKQNQNAKKLMLN